MKKSLKNYLFVLTGILFSTISYAQITFTLKDVKDKSALPAVSFNISKDTTKQTLISNPQGIVNVPNLTSGKCHIQTSYVGYMPMDTTMNITVGQNITLFLKEDVTQLKGVTVEAKKKFIEMKKGNFIMNIQESALAKTSNSWDALKYGPLVDARMDGTLKVQNKPATVFIDGRKILMSGEDLMKYLEISLPPILRK